MFLSVEQEREREKERRVEREIDREGQEKRKREKESEGRRGYQLSSTPYNFGSHIEEKGEMRTDGPRKHHHLALLCPAKPEMS